MKNFHTAADARALGMLAGAAAALVLTPTATFALSVGQTTIVTAPVASVAVARSHAGVYLNVVDSSHPRPGLNTVIVSQPVAAVAPPGTDVRIKLGGR